MAEDLGEFQAGEVPPPLEVTFVDNQTDQNPVNITGLTKFINIERFPAGTLTLGQGTVEITDGEAGEIEYHWHEDDMQETGDYTVLIWVTDGSTLRYATDQLTYTVVDGPGPTPAW
jgi:hypothetical protein